MQHGKTIVVGSYTEGWAWTLEPGSFKELNMEFF